MADPNLIYAKRFYEAALDSFDQGAYPKAMENINKAIAKAPKNADILSTKAVFLHKMNDLVQAIEAYQAALNADPHHAFSHFNIGLIFMKLGKTVNAIQAWKEVIRISPRDVDAIFNIAVALTQLGNQNEALLFYEKVLKIQSDHVQAHQNLGIIYRDKENFKKAKYHLKQLREYDSTYSEIVSSELIKCEEAEFLAKMVEANKKSAENKIEDFDGDDTTNALRAILEERFNDALDLSEKALRKLPTNTQARLIRGQALRGLARHADAITEFLGIVHDDPTCVEAHFQLANLFLGLDELEKSLEHFLRTQRLDPSYPLIDENIASIEAKIKKSN